jgi:hypothetical protein
LTFEHHCILCLWIKSFAEIIFMYFCSIGRKCYLANHWYFNICCFALNLLCGRPYLYIFYCKHITFCSKSTRHNTTFSNSISKIKLYKSVVRAKITVDLKYYRHDQKYCSRFGSVVVFIKSLQLRPYIRIHIRVYVQAGFLIYPL